ncbi:MAG: PqqD family protein [Pyrinomonadaceae bacterium]|nr:PqqD family protein [Pyrinomonadaceae bacterium]
MMRALKPLAKKQDLVVQELDGEFLVYDLKTNHAHCLNESASLIWRFCDGTRSISDLREAFVLETGTAVSEEFVSLALDQLSEFELFEESLPEQFSGMSRRSLIRKVGLMSAAALPIVSMLSFPNSALAFTCGPSICGDLPGTCPSGMTYCCRGSCQPDQTTCGAPCAPPANIKPKSDF